MLYYGLMGLVFRLSSPLTTQVAYSGEAADAVHCLIRSAVTPAN